MAEVNPTTVLHTMASAIEARLRLVFAEGVFDFSLMPASASVKELERIVKRKPFLGLAFSEIIPANFLRQFKGGAHWVVFLMCENEASAAARYTGDNLGIGMFGMTMAASALLHGWTVPGAGAVSVTKVETVRPDGWGEDAVAIVAVSICVEFSTDVAPGFPDDLADFLRLTVTWALPAPADAIPSQTILPRGP